MAYLELQGVQIPNFLYGTAWKEEATEGCVERALAAGFVGIDTANQRKHYFEEAVGKAVQKAILGGKSRADLFLQSKFTYTSSQDHRLPYDPKASFATQVRQSFESTLAHFGTDYLDSFLLHGPSTGRGLAAEDWEVWREMEALHQEKKVRLIGVSNVNQGQLDVLLKNAKVKPAFVQNRCYANKGWDETVRLMCRASGVVYQGFSLLTANLRELAKREVQSIVKRHGKTTSQVAFRFAQQVGMLPITGTKSTQHMKEDLAIDDFSLTQEELNQIEELG
jgi:diketogulonate reductase-like aldo/keto reductase